MNENRRKFLKIVLIGSASLAVGKIFGPLLSVFLEKSSHVESQKKIRPTAFKTVEDDKTLHFYDDTGAEVLQIDKTE